MLNVLLQLIPTILILGLLIFVHELGHFLACRLSRVKVDKFSIGFGPEVLTWKRGETVFAVSAIPLGGFVKPRGESFSELEAGHTQPGDFLAAPKMGRLFILLAGVMMNYFFAFLLMIPVYTLGRPVLQAKIGGFVEGYPAASSGLRIGDTITQVNGVSVKNWEEMTQSIFENRNPNLTLQVLRGQDMFALEISPTQDTARDYFGEERPVSRIGVAPAKEYDMEKFPLQIAIGKAFLTTTQATALTYKAIWRLVTGRLSVKTLSGPIGIMAMAGHAAKMGLVAVLQLTSLISISLAVINLLPIPALDGGHVLFLMIGWICRHEVSQKTQERVTQAGFAFLMGLMVLVVVNDLINIGAVEKIRMLFAR